MLFLPYYKLGPYEPSSRNHAACGGPFPADAGMETSEVSLPNFSKSADLTAAWKEVGCPTTGEGIP